MADPFAWTLHGHVSNFTVPSHTNVGRATFKPRRIHVGGGGRISGTVMIKGAPNYATHRKVWLIRDRDGLCIDEQWSDATTGAYSFDYVDERERYTVLAFDYQHNFRAVLGDNLQPSLIT